MEKKKGKYSRQRKLTDMTIDSIVSLRAELNVEIERIARKAEARTISDRTKLSMLMRGQKTLFDMLSTPMHVFLPKELCLFNLHLMGIDIDEAEFNEKDKRRHFGTPVLRNEIKHYDFRAVWRYFMFTPLINKNGDKIYQLPKRREFDADKARQIYYESIRRFDPTNEFFFDEATIEKLNKQLTETNPQTNKDNN